MEEFACKVDGVNIDDLVAISLVKYVILVQSVIHQMEGSMNEPIGP